MILPLPARLRVFAGPNRTICLRVYKSVMASEYKRGNPRGERPCNLKEKLQSPRVYTTRICVDMHGNVWCVCVCVRVCFEYRFDIFRFGWKLFPAIFISYLWLLKSKYRCVSLGITGGHKREILAIKPFILQVLSLWSLFSILFHTVDKFNGFSILSFTHKCNLPCFTVFLYCCFSSILYIFILFDCW